MKIIYSDKITLYLPYLQWANKIIVNDIEKYLFCQRVGPLSMTPPFHSFGFGCFPQNVRHWILFKTNTIYVLCYMFK